MKLNRPVNFEVFAMKTFKNTFNFNALLLAALILGIVSAASAQEKAALPPPANQDENRGLPLLQQLNLSPDQIEQIRTINRGTRDQMRAAAQKQREARRALDLAIYADNPNPAEVEQRAREFAEAQAQHTKLRAQTEFRIRQILSPEQLAVFRDLRRRAAERNLLKQPQRRFPGAQKNRPLRAPLKNHPPF
jgi:periplasmic protein CpxP/Spy